MLAFAMVATLQEAKQHQKAVPAPIVLRSAIDLAIEALEQFDLQEAQLDALMGQVFTVVMERFLVLGQEVLPPEELAQYQQFLQRVLTQMQSSAPQGAA